MSTATATSFVYGRQIDGVPERYVLLVAAPGPAHVLLHEEHTRGSRPDVLLNRLVPLAPEMTVEQWLQQRDRELQADGWGAPTRHEGIR